MLSYHKLLLSTKSIQMNKFEITVDRGTLSLKLRQSKNCLMNRISISLILLISAVTTHSSNDASFKVNDIKLTLNLDQSSIFKEKYIANS
jgi:hypothetical protein